ncbi:MAG TPA: hypothetical protein VMU67_01280 [Steroidobacteraceae bacterium]|nr:hypothetical protein [Steroidobacteraceae bacterium]
MSFPEPYPGLVIRYSYLWKRESDAGRDEGTKDRPCAIIMMVIDEDGDKEVWVLPITHSPPARPADAVEIPATTKNRLGLDSERFWVVITEANEFIWPGPDLRPVPGRDTSTIVYGPLPPRFFAYVRDRFLERDEMEKAARVPRRE